MKTLLPCELSPQSPSLSFIRQFYVKQELCGLRRMETTIKYEEVYLRAYANVPEARASIGRYLGFYNSRRPHSSLDGKTPDQAYFNLLTPMGAAV